MPTSEQLKNALLAHFAAEVSRDLDRIGETVAESCEYQVIGPYFPDDPQARMTAGNHLTHRQLWGSYSGRFSRYQIECGEDDMVVWPERNLVFARVRITAALAEGFAGLPANKPFCYQTGALCEFDDAGLLTREIVFGSLGQVLMDLQRMHEFLAESTQRERRNDDEHASIT